MHEQVVAFAVGTNQTKAVVRRVRLDHARRSSPATEKRNHTEPAEADHGEAGCQQEDEGETHLLDGNPRCPRHQDQGSFDGLAGRFLTVSDHDR